MIERKTYTEADLIQLVAEREGVRPEDVRVHRKFWYERGPLDSTPPPFSLYVDKEAGRECDCNYSHGSGCEVCR